MKKDIFIKVGLSIVLLSCLLHMPYGYYQLVRIVSVICFCLLAYNQYIAKKIESMILYIGLAVLFQPFVKISLGRDIWNAVDVVVAMVLVISIFVGRRVKE